MTEFLDEKLRGARKTDVSEMAALAAVETVASVIGARVTSLFEAERLTCVRPSVPPTRAAGKRQAGCGCAAPLPTETSLGSPLCATAWLLKPPPPVSPFFHSAFQIQRRAQPLVTPAGRATLLHAQRLHPLSEKDPSVAQLVTDAYGKILDGNVAASSLLFVEHVALPGRRLLNYIAGESRPVFYAAMMQLRAAESVAKAFTVLLRPRKNGPLVKASFTAVGKRDEARRLVAIDWFLRPLS